MTRYIIVSNRLPVSWNQENKQFERSSGGLVTAISAIEKEQLYWFGVLPDNSPPLEQSEKKLTNITLKAVRMPADIYHHYYNGYANDVLWPLFHYETKKCDYDDQYWQAYCLANDYFYQQLIEFIKPDDIIWIHDYQLCLLPMLLKKKFNQLKIGFFLHIPFPAVDIFKQLPQRKQILTALLASDLIGFQQYNYLHHFYNSVTHVLKAHGNESCIYYHNQPTELNVFPVSVMTKEFITKAGQITSSNKEIITFLGIDRIDYSKGLDLKLNAFEKLLQTYPNLREKLRLYQVAIPTRLDIPAYQQHKSMIDIRVNEINEQYGNETWQPVCYLTSKINQTELVKLYRQADVMLITSRFDGFNLVSLEYILSQDQKNPGVLLLSEFTGAFSQLTGAIGINPWDLDQVTERMYEAIHMPLKQRQSQWQPLFDQVCSYSATKWASSFIRRLESGIAKTIKPTNIIQTTSKAITTLLYRFGWQKGQKIVVFIDYDGTITPIATSPGEANLSIATKNALKALHKQGVAITVISGRDRHFLNQQFQSLPVELVAEHGAFSYLTNQQTWKDQINQPISFYEKAEHIMLQYSNLVYGSFIEKKQYSLAWHYRLSPKDYSEFQAKKLQRDLSQALQDYPASIIQGKKIIEVKHIIANKGYYLNQYIASQQKNNQPLFYIIIGDDRTDEDMFAVSKQPGLTIKVGQSPTKAELILSSQAEVLPFLQQLLIAIK